MADRMGQLSMVFVFSALIFLTWRDLSHTEQTNIEKDIKAPKLSKFAGPTLRFMFCFSWGYRKVFDQYAQLLHERFPALDIQGDNYPPPSGRAAVAQFLSIFKLFVIVMIVSGQNPFPHLNMETPSLFNWATENKIYACLMVFFISNAIEGQMISTGAFEVTFNDVPVWSKLETGRIPQPNEMFQIIENHMRLYTNPGQ